MSKNKSYIEFTEVFEGKKTSVYLVTTKSDDIIRLGIIKWHNGWRRYCFFPEAGTLFDCIYMNEIVGFIENLMEERR